LTICGEFLGNFLGSPGKKLWVAVPYTVQKEQENTMENNSNNTQTLADNAFLAGFIQAVEEKGTVEARRAAGFRKGARDIASADALEAFGAKSTPMSRLAIARTILARKAQGLSSPVELPEGTVLVGGGDAE